MPSISATRRTNAWFNSNNDVTPKYVTLAVNRLGKETPRSTICGVSCFYIDIFLLNNIHRTKLPKVLVNFAFTQYNEINRIISWRCRMDLMTVSEAAKIWGLTKRRVQSMCEMGQIKNAQRLGNMWVFPKTTKRPLDVRTKAAKIKDRLILIVGR
jgi:hypothetical protein